MTSTDLEQRRSQLDAFAAQPPRENLPVAQAFSAPSERVFGAQQVAVRRDEAQVLQRLKVLAAAAGENWYFRYPVKNKRSGTTDWIEGPSIKLANDLARMYGNADVDVRVMDIGESWIIYARFIDLETGFSMTRPFQQQKGSGKIGGDDSARRIDMAFQIGVSKAIRNVVVNSLQTFADFAFEEARNALVDRVAKKLPEYRARVIERLGEIRVDVRRAEVVVGRASDSWLAPDVARLIAMLKSISDGMADIEESFPQVERHDPETGEITPGRSSEADTKARTSVPVTPEQGVPTTPTGAQQETPAAADEVDDTGASAEPWQGTLIRGRTGVTTPQTGVAKAAQPVAAASPRQARQEEPRDSAKGNDAK